MRTTFTPRIDLLLGTLLENPSYARHVVYIDIRSSGFQSRYTGRRKPHLLQPISDHHQQLFQDLAVRAGFSDQEWIEGIKTSNFDVLAALLLWVCTHISVLELDLALCLDNIILTKICSHQPSTLASHSATRYQKLRIVDIGAPERDDLYGRYELQVAWRPFLPPLSSPILEMAHFYFVEDLTLNGFSDLTHFTTCHTLKTLWLKKTSISPKTLGKFRPVLRLLRLSFTRVPPLP